MSGLIVRVAVLAAVGLGALLVAPQSADAECRTTSVCVYQYGRQVCRSEQQCTTRRVPVCTFVNRCVPTRTCSSSFGRTTCIYRDVCRRQEVCS